jgi:hypothetical protein
VIRSARNAGAAFVGHRVLYLGKVTKENFMQFLAQHYPDLLPLYRRMYPGQYAPRTYENHVARIVGEEKQRAGPLESRYISPPDAPQQITLL